MKRWGVWFVAVFLALSLINTAPADVGLVRDGKPLADIVVATNALSGVKLAARDLQEYLEKMSGVRLEIVNAPSDTVKAHVYVGENEFTRKLGFKLGEFKNSGFEIVAKNKAVILAGVDKQRTTPYEGPAGLEKWQEFCGEKFSLGHGRVGIGDYNKALDIFTNDDLGTWYAVAELLEQLGVRWYAPYDNGTVVPEKRTIAIADQQLKKVAAFARREFCYYGTMREDRDGIAWFKRLKLGNHSVIIFNHTTYDIYSSKEQQELHPEYLACGADGKPYSGYPAGRGMPRYTNPGFRKAAALYMNKAFEAFPELTAMSIGNPDGGVKMDARDVDLYGKPTDSINQKASQYVWDFHLFLARELKQAHPDKYLLFFTGGGADEFPRNLTEFPDNMILPLGNSGANIVLNGTVRATRESRQRWFARMKTIRKGPMWDYFLYYRTPSVPRYPIFFTDALQRNMQECLPYCDGKFIEIQPGQYRVDGEKNPRSRLGVHGLIHLMVYWQSKLYWDPGMDRRKMLEEYYELFFGPARAEMKEFHEFAEAVWSRQESRSVTPTTGFLKEKDVERYFEILKRARERAGADTVYDKRIAQMEGEMASLKTLFASLKRTGPRIEAHQAPAPVKIDGDLGKYPAEWRIPLRNHATGELPSSNKTDAIVALTPDRSALIVGVTCYDNQMDNLKAATTLNDTFSIFDDDVVEVYVNTPERSYFKIVVNPNGAIYDQSTDVTIVDRDTLPILWNPGTKAVVRKYDDRWTVELMIPTRDFGTQGPTEAGPWGIQVGRTRLTGGDDVSWSIAPAPGPYATLNRWGDLYMSSNP